MFKPRSEMNRALESAAFAGVLVVIFSMTLVFAFELVNGVDGQPTQVQVATATQVSR